MNMDPETIARIELAICKISKEIEKNELQQASDPKIIESLAKLIIARTLIRND